jgi:hypothetical protein
MLTWIVRGAAAIAIVNLVALVALQVAYAWHHVLEPKRDRRRARQRSFERLLAETLVDNRATVAQPADALEPVSDGDDRSSIGSTDTTSYPRCAPSVFRSTSLASVNR